MRYENRWENRAEGEGHENWMCSKACGQVVSRARACGSRGVTSRITSRDSPPVRVRLRRHCLFFPISSRFCRASRSSVCVVAMTTIASGKVVRTQKYQTLLVLFFFRRVRQRGDARDSRYSHPLQRDCSDTYETRVYAAKTITFHCRALFCNSRLCLLF